MLSDRPGVNLLPSLLLVVGVLGWGAWHEIRIQEQGRRIQELENRIINLENLDEINLAEEEYIKDRSRRESPVQYNTQNPLFTKTRFRSDDGIPILNQKYKNSVNVYEEVEKEGDAQGFKVYNAWFNHKREKDIKNDPRVVWSHPTDSPVRPYHRKSAAWSSIGDEDDEDDIEFKTYGNSLNKDKMKRIKTNSHFNSINLLRNRVKVTDAKEYQASIATATQSTSTTTTTTTASTTTTTTTTSSTTSDVFTSVASQQVIRERGYRNRAGLRSHSSRSNGRHSRQRGHSSGREGRRGELSGLLAVHMQAEPDVEDSAADGIFRNWSMARWAKRLHLDDKFALEDGRLGISSPGVYYIYAQINYLDEHDVNGFQIYVNETPFVLCTTMTHTPQQTTKVNTCYTGGVVFLEQGDTVHIKNLEKNRISVFLPAHSFFGLVQLSQAGI
ncbi:protein eiger [Eurytemora carolleeae]|uniref:protein eiger n=1 Tax=Eurytemora carolleeae TaxID=1294199 RepID=UPI000C76FD6E|nr:protein eiger [Eurytemora carolleeae]|eukprot:XP_023328572.1 protein eiger-like [Eurytemora affinis]